MVDGIRHQVQTAKVSSDDVPRELTETELAEIQSFGAEETGPRSQLPAAAAAPAAGG